MRSNSYDIFISYAHVDDDPLPGIVKGWVSTFVDGLRKNLARELGRPDAYSLWMDYELRGHEPVKDAIHGQLSTAKTMVLFLSKGYLASSWCMEELDTFAGRLGPDANRIFPVYVSPVDEIPQSLKQLRKYDFWLEEREGPRTLADPQPIPTERDYYQRIRRLARELTEKLKGIPKQTPTTDGLTVFVNGGELDIELLRATAARLKEQGCGYMLPLATLESTDGNSPTSAEEITRDLHDNLESCNAVLVLFRKGPRSQVRQYINGYRKHKTRSDTVPERIHLCQAQTEPENLGIHIPELHVVCTSETYVDECVEWFLRERSP